MVEGLRGPEVIPQRRLGVLVVTLHQSSESMQLENLKHIHRWNGDIMVWIH